MCGKLRRLRKLLRPDTMPTILLPMDDSLLSGPEAGLRRPATLVSSVDGHVDAVLAFAGFARHHLSTMDAGLVVNLTASTTNATYTHKRLVTSVADAVRVGADAVAVHVNIGASAEGAMLETLGTVVGEADGLGIPVLALAYPRAETPHGWTDFDDVRRGDETEYARMVRHAVRVATDLGADVVKTRFTGSAGSFATVVEAADPVPVLTAGGPVIDDEHTLAQARMAVRAGGAGVSFGRNVFQRADPQRFLIDMRAALNDEATAAG